MQRLTKQEDVDDDDEEDEDEWNPCMAAGYCLKLVSRHNLN
jgi:hypothetical protein